jgi:hypothetical protein
MTMTSFEFKPIEPYAVDPGDKLTHGRLLHAAARGDKRAALTLAEHRRKQEPAAQPDPPHTGSVATGRELFSNGTDGGDAA